MKKSISCSLSHQNPATYLSRAVLACKLCLICADFSPDSDQTRPLFPLEEALLWTHILVENVLMLDLFQLLSSPDVNWWTGVVWITCGLLWCFYQLFGLSFWRHPFTAEHPLLRHRCNATFLQIWWRNKLILILDGLKCSFLGELYFSNICWLTQAHRLALLLFSLMVFPERQMRLSFTHTCTCKQVQSFFLMLPPARVEMIRTKPNRRTFL